MNRRLPPWVATHGAAHDEAELREHAALTPAQRWERFAQVSRLAALLLAANDHSDALRWHVRRSGGGFTFGSYAELEVLLDRLLEHPELRDALGAAGRAYVQREYAWPELLDRYERFLAHVGRRSSTHV